MGRGGATKNLVALSCTISLRARGQSFSKTASNTFVAKVPGTV